MSAQLDEHKPVMVGKSERDRQLLARIAEGDKDAFKELYINYQPRLVKFCSRILKNDVALAADIADEALIAVWDSAESFSGKSQASTWIHSIARFRLIAYLRKSKEVLLEDDSMALVLVDESVSAEDEILSSEANDELLQSISKLSDKHRQVIELVYFKELSVKEVAKVLNISDNTVKTRMFYARNKLKSILSSNSF